MCRVEGYVVWARVGTDWARYVSGCVTLPQRAYSLRLNGHSLPAAEPQIEAILPLMGTAKSRAQRRERSRCSHPLSLFESESDQIVIFSEAHTTTGKCE